MSRYRAAAFKAYPDECNECGFGGSVENPLEVHHIDRDRTNNAISNLQILCHQCHLIEHRPTDVAKDEELRVQSFTLTVSLIAWIDEESKRRGVKKSVLVREILDAARTGDDEQAEQERTAA